MNKGIKVKMNKAALKKLSQAQITALELTGEKILGEKIEQQQIPFQEGTLQNVQTSIDDSLISQGRLEIVHNTPYATRLYYNPQFDFDQTFNTNAQGEWWEDYISGDKKDRASKLYGIYYKRMAGGYVK